MKKVLSLIFLVFLLASLVSASEYYGKFQVSNGGGSVNIGVGCTEDWSSSSYCNQQNVLICRDANNCGTTNLKPIYCDTTASCIPAPASQSSSSSSSGGGGGGGGGSIIINKPSSLSSSSSSGGGSGSKNESCIEKWNCEDWSNKENSCGTRACTDENKCGTSMLKPKTSEKCAETGFFGMTGAVIGGVSDFAKTKTGISIIFILVIVGLFVLITLHGNKKRTLIDGEQKKDATIQANHKINGNDTQ